MLFRKCKKDTCAYIRVYKYEERCPNIYVCAIPEPIRVKREGEWLGRRLPMKAISRDIHVRVRARVYA